MRLNIDVLFIPLGINTNYYLIHFHQHSINPLSSWTWATRSFTTLLSNFNPRCQLCSGSERWIYGWFDKKNLSVKDFFANTVSNLLGLLYVFSTCLNSLSNDANNCFMSYQKYVLKWKKYKTRFQSKTQFSYNQLPKIATLLDRLDS